MFQQSQRHFRVRHKNAPCVGVSQVGKGSHAACYHSDTKGAVPLLETWLYRLTDVPT